MVVLKNHMSSGCQSGHLATVAPLRVSGGSMNGRFFLFVCLCVCVCVVFFFYKSAVGWLSVTTPSQIPQHTFFWDNWPHQARHLSQRLRHLKKKKKSLIWIPTAPLSIYSFSFPHVGPLRSLAREWDWRLHCTGWNTRHQITGQRPIHRQACGWRNTSLYGRRELGGKWNWKVRRVCSYL